MGKSKTFDYDLAYGESRENAFVAILGNEAKIEIKSDRGAVRTGNIFTEFESRGKTSGIASTEAEWTVYEVLPDVFCVMRTSRLLYLMSQVPSYVRGGDNNSSKGKLLKVSTLLAPTDVEKIDGNDA